MSKKQKPSLIAPRLPRGFEDRAAADIAATSAMIAKIREVYERYGFDPVETPVLRIYRDARQIPARLPTGPMQGVFSLQDDDEQWMSLRYDLTAPLARHFAENFETPAQALPHLPAGLCLPQRKARARPLPPVHAVRRRHRRRRRPRGRCRNVHDDGRHHGCAGLGRANTWCGSTTARCWMACWTRSALTTKPPEADRPARHRQARQVRRRRMSRCSWALAAKTRAAISRKGAGLDR